MRCTVLPEMLSKVPRQPAWVSPTAFASEVANKTGRQSAINMASGTAGSLLIRASPTQPDILRSTPAPLVCQHSRLPCHDPDTRGLGHWGDIQDSAGTFPADKPAVVFHLKLRLLSVARISRQKTMPDLPDLG